MWGSLCFLPFLSSQLFQILCFNEKVVLHSHLQPFHFYRAGGGCWRTGADGDGERAVCPGQGWGAGLCPAGKLQQRSSLHREPAAALQRKPHLCSCTQTSWFVPQHVGLYKRIKCQHDVCPSTVLPQTYIGSVLVSVNPYKELEIYSKQQMERYRGVSFYEISPHMWVALSSFHAFKP